MKSTGFRATVAHDCYHICFPKSCCVGKHAWLVLLGYNYTVRFSTVRLQLVLFSTVRLQLHGAIYRPDSFVFMLRYCANLKAIRYESTSLNRMVADKSHRVIAALVDGWVRTNLTLTMWAK